MTHFFFFNFKEAFELFKSSFDAATQFKNDLLIHDRVISKEFIKTGKTIKSFFFLIFIFL